nr:MAG TPA: hypothetical protein [Caudoviricetes sp.]
MFKLVDYTFFNIVILSGFGGKAVLSRGGVSESLVFCSLGANGVYT